MKEVEKPLPAVIPAYPTGAAIYGLSKDAWFRATQSGGIQTVTINGRKFLQVAMIEEHVGRKLTWADIQQPPPKPRGRHAHKAATP